jgi:hypothetical protein
MSTSTSQYGHIKFVFPFNSSFHFYTLLFNALSKGDRSRFAFSPVLIFQFFMGNSKIRP